MSGVVHVWFIAIFLLCSMGTSQTHPQCSLNEEVTVINLWLYPWHVAVPLCKHTIPRVIIPNDVLIFLKHRLIVEWLHERFVNSFLVGSMWEGTGLRWKTGRSRDCETWKRKEISSLCKPPNRNLPSSCYSVSSFAAFMRTPISNIARGYFIVTFGETCYFLFAMFIGGKRPGRGRGGAVASWGTGGSKPANDLLWWLLEKSVVSSLILGDDKKWDMREETWFTEKGLLAYKRAPGLCL